jgi:hypothetical protein
MRYVYEVNTVERTERRYLVEFTDKDVATYNDTPVNQVDDEDRKVYAEEMVTSGNIAKFTEGNADIEEVLSVEEQKK